MVSLLEPPLLSRLKRHDRILIAGAGGGFDVYAGLPLVVALRSAGKQVFLANLTFTYLGETDAQYLAPHLAAVTPATTGADRYFPERPPRRETSGVAADAGAAFLIEAPHPTRSVATATRLASIVQAAPVSCRTSIRAAADPSVRARDAAEMPPGSVPENR